MMILPVFAAAQDSGNKSLDVRSSVGDLHLGSDADPREIGLPAYPGARVKHDDNSNDNNSANLALFTSAFGVKLVVINYTSNDSPDKIIAFYRDKLKRYGKVIECRGSSDGPHVQVHEKSKELTCDGDDKGNEVELKVGTQDNQHAVAVAPDKSGTGTTFALVYVYARGKQGDI
jgi:hypothetical protein